MTSADPSPDRPAPDPLPPDEVILERLGARVRSRRGEFGWSLRELAKRAELSPRFLSEVESGTGNISFTRLARLAHALRVSVPELARPVSRCRVRGQIDQLLSGRDEAELTRLRHVLETTLGQRVRQVIALLGIRGAGKSAVGELVAGQLGVPLVELDELISDEAEMSIADVFVMHGEPHYRMLEARCLARLIEQDRPCVVALPGGVVGNDEAFRLLRSTCFSVWLRANAKDYWERVLQQGDTRPTRDRSDAMEHLVNLIADREPRYRQAQLTVQTSGVELPAVARRVVTGIRRGLALDLAHPHAADGTPENEAGESK